uniref:G_PROTEIN_RECEP_F1_2 domain-containing protein n=1 Tax=Syphacia muris TaxID=451379 RepID=A0A0N5ARR4_9BILA
MTLWVTIETVLCVLLPFAFRHYCTRRFSMALLVASFSISSCIHVTFLFTHVVDASPTFLEFNFDSIPCYWFVKTYNMHIINDQAYKLYEKLYYWTQMTLSIVLPTVTMLICSILVITRFTFKELGKSFSQRRKCVIMMTVSTTMSHLLLEGPASLTFGIAALKGTGDMKINSTMCMINHSNNLLSIINATIPFFVYLICNKQFRCMASVFITAICSTNPTHKRILLAQACARTRSITARNNEQKTSLVQLTYQS